VVGGTALLQLVAALPLLLLLRAARRLLLLSWHALQR
jgi:hypothetical protein